MIFHCSEDGQEQAQWDFVVGFVQEAKTQNAELFGSGFSLTQKLQCQS